MISQVSILQVRILSDEFLEMVKAMQIKKNTAKFELLHNAYWYGVMKTLYCVGTTIPPIIIEALKEKLMVNDVLKNIKIE